MYLPSAATGVEQGLGRQLLPQESPIRSNLRARPGSGGGAGSAYCSSARSS